MKSEGKSNREISRSLGRSSNAIDRFVGDNATGTRYGATGRKRLLDERDDRQIWREIDLPGGNCKRVRTTLHLDCSDSTVLRAVRRNPYQRYSKKKKRPALSREHKAKRLAWANDRYEWNEQWHSVMFSDEKKFNLDGPDGNQYYWHDIRQEEQHFFSRQQGGGGVMVWAAFSYGRKCQIKIIDEILNSANYLQIINSQLMPNFDTGTMLFQQDNASIHVSRLSKEWFNRNNVNLLPWPAKSPDLNPMENAWAAMVRNIYRDNKQYHHIDELKAAILREWQTLPQADLDNLVDSMPHRLAKVRTHRGDFIGY